MEVTRVTPNRSGRAKSGVKYTEPEPLEPDEDDEMANGKAADDEDDEEEGEDGEEPEEYEPPAPSTRWEASGHLTNHMQIRRRKDSEPSLGEGHEPT